MNVKLEAIAADFVRLGIRDQQPEEYPTLDSYDGLHELVCASAFIGGDVVELGIPPNLSTKLGKRTLQLCQNGVEFSSTFDTCCEEAEPKLLANLSRASIRNANWRSPVIISNGTTPVGIIKQYGEHTCYALADIPEMDLIAGTFASVHSLLEETDIKPSPTAWQLPIEAIATFTPVRFSIFSLPPSGRRLVRCGAFTSSEIEKRVVSTTHQQIVGRAKQLLQYARPLDLG